VRVGPERQLEPVPGNCACAAPIIAAIPSTPEPDISGST